uniref:Uncharacterized protein n=1 Tax=viral metagenome TaxID=1070528 RepID=A0A6M3XXV9_9ZZZZ
MFAPTNKLRFIERKLEKFYSNDGAMPINGGTCPVSWSNQKPSGKQFVMR